MTSRVVGLLVALLVSSVAALALGAVSIAPSQLWAVVTGAAIPSSGRS